MGKKIAIDTYYFNDSEAKTVGFIFNDWGDAEPSEVVESWSFEFGPYIPGEFYKRELPCIMGLLEKVPDLWSFDAIIIDGLARLPNTPVDKPDGLGWRLEKELIERGMIDNRVDGGSEPARGKFGHPGIIGVAKTAFAGIEDDRGTSRVYRGKSKTPLYVNTTWFGYSSWSAGECIKSMAGSGRIPDLLRRLDKETKTR